MLLNYLVRVAVGIKHQFGFRPKRLLFPKRPAHFLLTAVLPINLLLYLRPNLKFDNLCIFFHRFPFSNGNHCSYENVGPRLCVVANVSGDCSHLSYQVLHQWTLYTRPAAPDLRAPQVFKLHWANPSRGNFFVSPLT